MRNALDEIGNAPRLIFEDFGQAEAVRLDYVEVSQDSNPAGQ